MVASCRFVLTGRGDVSAEQLSRDGGGVDALGGKLEDELHNGSGFRVRLHSAIGAFSIAVGTDFALILAALHLGVLGALGFNGHIAAVMLADEVLERHVHAAGVALEFAAVKIVADGNEAGMEQWEHTLDEVAGFNAVTPEAGKILDNDAVDLIGPHQLNELLYLRTLKICAAVPIVDELHNLRVQGFGHGSRVLVEDKALIFNVQAMAGLMIQNLSRELFAVADENGGKLKNRVILFCDELGTMPPFDILPLFSAGRSRRLTLVPIIQSLAQLEKNYGKEGASILMDNCQDVICGGFAPNSEAAETFSKALGSRTVLSGSVSRGKNDPSQSLQMMERPLLTADELKSIPKGSFIVQKTGCHPMRARLRLFLEWGITFEEKYRVEEQAARKVYYADQNALTRAIMRKYPPKLPEQKTTRSVKGEGQLHDAPVQEMVVAEDIDYDRMAHKRTPYNLPRQEVDR